MDDHDERCGGCSRRTALGWISAAAVGALVGVEVTAGGDNLVAPQ